MGVRGRRPREDRARSAGDTNARAVIIALVAALVAVFLFWVTAHDSWFNNAGAVQSTLNQIAGLIIATGLLSAGWELIGKRRFASEVLEKAKLSSDVVDAGITRVTDQYLEDVAWTDLFHGSRHMDVVVAYARTWRNTHTDKLKALAKTSGARIRVFLPDPTDPQTMEILADRFAVSTPEIKATVEEAIREFSALDPAMSGAVEVWTRQGDAVFSCYRFDSRAVLTLYSHSRERRTSVQHWL